MSSNTYGGNSGRPFMSILTGFKKMMMHTQVWERAMESVLSQKNRLLSWDLVNPDKSFHVKEQVAFLPLIPLSLAAWSKGPNITSFLETSLALHF